VPLEWILEVGGGRGWYYSLYNTKRVIRSFHDRNTEMLFVRETVPRWANIARVALRRLRLLHRARTLADLQALPGNRLEALKGTRKGQHSIRVNDQYRVCFRWKDGDAYDVELTDYH
jgi:proteic killer suppression protein